MKSVLLYANDDSGLESRFQAALDVARVFEGHLLCLQVTPFDSFIMADPFGGVYALPTLVAAVEKADSAHRAKLEARLRVEDVSWDWMHFEGNPAQTVIDRARLCDLIVLTMPTNGVAYDGPLSLTADTALHARTPVLAVPQASRGFDVLGPAIVAWNGSQESCNALRLNLAMLQKASAVHVVTVAGEVTEFPSTYAAHYLARHGVEVELHEWRRDDLTTAEALIEAATRLGAGYVTMGAYGHSRFRETVLGGATHDMLTRSPVPLLLAH